MSKFLEERVANPGKYVYVPFAPTNPGVIVRRISTNRVQVKFVNTLLGKKTDIFEIHDLNDFDTLVAETAKRLDTHNKSLEKLKSL